MITSFLLARVQLPKHKVHYRSRFFNINSFMVYLEWLVHVLYPNISFLHSLNLCCTIDLVQIEYHLQHLLFDFFNMFILWMSMTIIIMSIIYFNFVHFTLTQHTIQLWKFVNDKYIWCKWFFNLCYIYIYIYICPQACLFFFLVAHC